MTDSDKPTDKPAEPRNADEPTREGLHAPTPSTEEEPRRGQVRYQDAETTRPREPTLAERRARQKARQEAGERERAEVEASERKRTVRKRLLIGGGVTVGVVALVAAWYIASTPDEVTAHCVSTDDVLAVDENVCDENYVRSHGGYHSGGIFFLPILGGGYSQYRYNYGGTVGPGGRIIGGSLTAPSTRVTVKTASGKTVQRGGFGISGGGKSGGS
jgi:hypothetical protein